MTSNRFVASVLLGLLTAIDLSAADPIAGKAKSGIDAHLAKIHQQADVTPAPLCDDATFFRRLTLDLLGRVPTVIELQEFIASPDRSAAVDRRLLRARDISQFVRDRRILASGLIIFSIFSEEQNGYEA